MDRVVTIFLFFSYSGGFGKNKLMLATLPSSNFVSCLILAYSSLNYY